MPILQAARTRWIAIAASILMWMPSTTSAGDQADAPGTLADPAADIGSVYAWYSDSIVTTVVTYSPLLAPGAAGSYDADVLYGVHVDSNGDGSPEVDIWIRFGQDSEGAWGVQFENVPGTSGPVVGNTETVITDGSGLRMFAGVADDPLYFDLVGLQNTTSVGVLSFDHGRDGLAGYNTMAIVFEWDAGSLSDSMQLWATTARIE